jgi:hypothetical protein
MDMLVGEAVPKRGDRLSSPKSLYYVLSARPIRRRDPEAPARFKLWVVKADELEQATRFRLMWSAIRADGSSKLFEFTWYPRKKKRMTFEQLMKAGG